MNIVIALVGTGDERKCIEGKSFKLEKERYTTREQLEMYQKIRKFTEVLIKTGITHRGR